MHGLFGTRFPLLSTGGLLSVEFLIYIYLIDKIRAFVIERQKVVYLQ